MESKIRESFARNWLGPYMVKRKFRSKAYHLADLEVNEEHEPINIMHLYPFYSYNYFCYLCIYCKYLDEKE